MRDGIVLRADLYRPPGSGRFPVLVHRTPYSRTESPPDPLVLAAVRRGYAVVLQDVRGRYGSGGVFEAYRQEGRDGFDTIEWAARQAWSNGAVGTFGLSYPGAVQWLAAVERPPSLKAMVPAMTFSTPENFWYSGGVWDGSWLDWTWLNIAPDLRRRLDVAGPRTDEEAARSWDRDGRRGARVPADARPSRLQGSGTLVLRVDAPSARRCLVELRAASRALRPGQRRGAQPLRLVRRDVRSERRRRELRGRGRRARPRALDPWSRVGAAPQGRRTGLRPLGGAGLRRDGARMDGPPPEARELRRTPGRRCGCS